MNIEVKNTRVATIIKEAIDDKVVDLKSLLQGEVNGNMDMIAVTELVTDINELSEVSNQINVKLQFGTTETE